MVRTKQLTEKFFQSVTSKRYATYAAAILRIGLGALTLLILLLHLPNFSFSFGEASRWGIANHGAVGGGYPWPISSIFSREDPDSVLYLKTAVMAAFTIAFMLGWRSRVTGLIFAIMWLSFSTLNPVITNTGHFHTFRVLLIFTLFTQNNHRWSVDSWLNRRRERFKDRSEFFRAVILPGEPGRFVPTWVSTVIHNGAIALVAFQVCIIYFVSALWKLQGDLWPSGVAAYYPLRLEELAIFPHLNDLVWQITPIVFIGSWIAIYGQLLFPFMLPWRITREINLLILIGMHLGIGVLLSLPFFSLTMLLADMVFIDDARWRSIIVWIKKRMGRVVEPKWQEEIVPL